MSRYQSYNSPWHTLTISEVWHYHYDNECPGHARKPEGNSYPEIDWDLAHPEECPVNVDRCCCHDEKLVFIPPLPLQQCPDCTADNHDNCYRCYPRCDVEMDVGENWQASELPMEVGTYRIRIANAGYDYWGEYDYDVEIEEIKDSVHD